MMLTAALLGLVAGATTVHADSSRRLLSDKVTIVDGWKQCGGVNGCGESDSKPCEDVAWPAYNCTTGYECQRQNEWFWQCSPVGDITALVGGGIPKAAELKPGDFGRYTQCGGNIGNCGDYCADCAWPTGQCEEGFKCGRQSAAYWQCQLASEVNGTVKVCAGKTANTKPRHVKVNPVVDDYDLADLLAADGPAPTPGAAPAKAPAARPGSTIVSDLNDVTGEKEAPAPAPAAEEEAATPAPAPTTSAPAPTATEAAPMTAPVEDPLATATDPLATATDPLAAVPASPVRSCSAESADTEVDGVWMTGLFMEGMAAEGLLGACCAECVKLDPCAGFQVNLFNNGTSFTCELFSKVNELVPATGSAAGVILSASGVSAAVAGRK